MVRTTFVYRMSQVMVMMKATRLMPAVKRTPCLVLSLSRKKSPMSSNATEAFVKQPHTEGKSHLWNNSIRQQTSVSSPMIRDTLASGWIVVGTGSCSTA